MAFRIGQKVVCVDDSPGKHTGTVLALNGVYTIRGFDRFAREPEGPGLYLEEVYQRARRGNPGDGEEIAWKRRRFRPLVTKSTDTGFAILEDIRKRESVPADERALTARERQREGQS